MLWENAMRTWLVVILFSLLGACSVGIQLASPPNLYLEGTNYPSNRVASVLRTSTPEIFYVTNRAREGVSYGAARSSSKAFGAARVRFGTDLTWEELVRRTHVDAGRRISQLNVESVNEMVRFNETPLPYSRKDGSLTFLPDVSMDYAERTMAFQQALRAHINETGNDRLLVYIHGFNNDFDDGLTTLANLWHFSGPNTTPIVFTWPAGNGAGPLGYFRDRDAGRYSVYHTKEFLRMLANMPEVEQIDIVAHSRGTDVITTALRELMIFARGANEHPKLALKTGIFIMAAPDLDIGIVRQRLQAERLSEAFEQINLYINPNDAALRLSALLTRSTRLGALRNEDFIDGELELLRKEALVHFIRVENVRGGFGHTYFRDNPAVLSDIVLALRTRAFPGGTLRPLEQDENGVWVLHSNYPLERLPEISHVLLGEDR